MRRMILKLTTAIALVLLPAMANADMKIIAGQITGSVIDQSNEKPISGAYVMVKWTGGVSSWGEGGSRCTRATSVRADEAGKFTVPAWSKSDPGFANLSAELVPYSPGFEHVGWGSAQGASPKAALGFIPLDELEMPAADVTLKMRRFEGSDTQRGQYLSEFLLSTTCGSEDMAGTRPAYEAIDKEVHRLPPDALMSSKKLPGVIGVRLDELVQRYLRFSRDGTRPALTTGERK